MNKTIKNLITELAQMIESGSITVGALGLSQESADYVFDLYRLNCEIDEMKLAIKEKRKEARRHRALEMIKLREKGMTLAKVGKECGISRQRVEQIIGREGYTRKRNKLTK